MGVKGKGQRLTTSPAFPNRGRSKLHDILRKKGFCFDKSSFALSAAYKHERI
jgi:hypothetical protein